MHAALHSPCGRRLALRAVPGPICAPPPRFGLRHRYPSRLGLGQRRLAVTVAYSPAGAPPQTPRRWRGAALGLAAGLAALGVAGIAVVAIAYDGSAQSQPPHRLMRSDFIDDRPTMSLLRSLFVYEMCQYEAVVDWSPRLLAVFRSLGLQSVSNSLVRWTFFRQFCGGESPRDVAPTMRYLRGYGIGSILDLSVEADVGTVDDRDAQTQKAEHVAQQVQKCIETASILPGNFAAVKVTGFGDIQALENISAALSYTWDAYRWLCDTRAGGNQAHMQRLDAKGFRRLVRMLPGGAATSDADIAALFAKVDGDGDGFIDWIDLSDRVNPLHADTRPLFIGQISAPPSRVLEDPVEVLNESSLITGNELAPQLPTPGAVDMLITSTERRDDTLLPATSNRLWSVSEKFLPAVSVQDMEQLDAVIARLCRVCNLASERRVRLMIDAEQSYFQPAIDLVTVELMRRYNRPDGPDGPVVYSTYQMYLRDGLLNLNMDLERAIRSQRRPGGDGAFLFAAKLVRGAYLNSERLRSSVLGIRDPINPTPEATHAMYNAAIDVVLEHAARSPVHLSEAAKSPPRIGVVIATHNSKSIEVAIDGLRQRGIHPRSGVVSFAQLLGMYDVLTYRLAEDGYLVGKYIPYGPVQDVIPYLLRRAQENRAVLRGSLDGAVDDRQLIRNELKRRCRVWLRWQAD